MPNQRRPDRVNVSVHLDADLFHVFEAYARTRGGKSAVLRTLIADAVSTSSGPPASASTAIQSVTTMSVRLTGAERDQVRLAAADKSMAPSTWVRSLVRAHVLRRPQWGEFERQGFAAVLTALARIGNNVNQIARGINVAVLSGEYPAGQGSEAREAVADTKRALAQLGEMVGRDLDYWGTRLTPAASRTRAKRGRPAPNGIGQGGM